MKRFAAFLIVFLQPILSLAAVRLPALMSDRMVLQREMPVRIWGWADPQEKIRVTFQDQKVETVAKSDGTWEAFLMPLRAGGPEVLTIAGGNTLQLKDVLIGEVWVASGQSNMEWTLDKAKDATQEIAAADHPKIRFFKVTRKVADEPLRDVEGSWQTVSPATAASLSAVGYFFARSVQAKAGVPVAVLQSAWGGTPAQAWTSRGPLKADPLLAIYFDRWERALQGYPAAKAEYDVQQKKWEAEAAAAKARQAAPPRPPALPRGPGHPHSPTGLYNGMIAPLVPFTIRGAIWYQGESNAGAGEAFLYRRLFPTMILDWREAWGQGSFPFLFVQLANFKNRAQWPLLRESQLRTLLDYRDMGMAVTIDVGNSTDIHPTDKQTVGDRLARIARAQVYGEKLLYSGPVYRRATTQGSEMRLWFDHTGKTLKARSGSGLAGFVVAGPDKRWVPADARLDGTTIVVSSKSVSNPTAVRYAWTDDPIEANLVNEEGLPASPFRTDNWADAEVESTSGQP